MNNRVINKGRGLMLSGAHESIAGGIFNAVYLGQQATCDTIQIFNESKNQWRADKFPAEEIERFFKALEKTGVSVVCSHTGYLINIASPDKELNEKSFHSLKEEMERCEILKIPMILETPKGEDLKEAIENLKILRSLVKK